MSHAPPPVPKDQRSPGPNLSGQSAPGASSGDAAEGPSGEPTAGRRDLATGAQSADPGDADVNIDEQGRFANIKQNTTHTGHQQDR